MANIKVQRTAGPLGRAFGFSLDIWRLHVSFNAGWYIVFLNWRGLGYIHLAAEPLQVEWYIVGVSR